MNFPLNDEFLNPTHKLLSNKLIIHLQAILKGLNGLYFYIYVYIYVIIIIKIKS